MKLIIAAIIFISAISFAQSSMEKFTPELNSVINYSNQNEELLVWVFFTDKGTNTQNYFQKPSTVVSEKSLKRRAKVLNEDKLISETDLPVDQNYIEQVQSLGFKLKQKTKWFNGISGFVTKDKLAQISALPFVKQLDIVYRFRKNNFEDEVQIDSPEESGNNNLSKSQGTHSFNYGQSFTQLNQITVPQVHDLGYTGTGVTICLMDAGFDRLTHQVFSSMNIIATWDFVNGDPNVQNHGDLGNGSHGTATLSLIGGFYETKLIGPAFGADFILAKTENTESETPIEEDNWLAALEWADSIGVDITSTSLGYIDFDPPYPSYTWEHMDGNTCRITNSADYGASLGIFVVNSAGNEGSHPSHNTLGAPADGDSVIAVGAVNSTGSRSSFSSVGPTVDGRIKPDLMAMGSNNYIACNSNNTCYSNGGGTSYSCPLVAGASALLLQADPSLTPMQLAALLKNTASRSNNPDRFYGWGIINTYAALQSLLTNAENKNNIPDNFYLLQNYPNPFNPSTKVRFAVPELSDVKLYLHDILGNEIAVLFDDEVYPGIREIDLNGSSLSSGVYFIRMVANNYHQTIKISLLK